MSAICARRLNELELGEVQVQEFGDAGDVLIRVARSQGGDDSAEQAVVEKVRDDAAATTTTSAASRWSARASRANSPAPARSACSSRSSAILVYIWFRFEWQFAVGAIIATVHDVVLTIGFFVDHADRVQPDQIAAILTIVGYSLNDTVVVFDRIRENLRRYKKMPLERADRPVDQPDAVAHDA